MYQQVDWKLEETLKYYDIYNMLDSTLSFIQKEVKLLNSIGENFADAMRSASSKLEFSKQFDTIVKGVEEQLKRQESLLTQKHQRVEEQKLIYQSVCFHIIIYFMLDLCMCINLHKIIFF